MIEYESIILKCYNKLVQVYNEIMKQTVRLCDELSWHNIISEPMVFFRRPITYSPYRFSSSTEIT